MTKVDKEQMKKGYVEMGSINLKISNEFAKVEFSEYKKYEKGLRNE